jgi:hypothetical protein
MTADQPATIADMLAWCGQNGVTPIPCRPRSKGPAGCISTRSVYGDTPPSPGDLLQTYGRSFFGSTVRDSFHVPSPERIRVIEAFWADPGVRALGPESLGVSLDMNYPTADGCRIACIDVDSDAYRDLFEERLFLRAPVVTGKKGGKLFFKLDRDRADPPPILQYTTAENLRRPGREQDPPAIEIFTGQKHALVFGEHPESSAAAPLHYTFTRGFTSPLPVLGWQDVSRAILGYAGRHGLVLRKDEVSMDPCQRTLIDGYPEPGGRPPQENTGPGGRMLGQNTLAGWEREQP